MQRSDKRPDFKQRIIRLVAIITTVKFQKFDRFKGIHLDSKALLCKIIPKNQRYIKTNLRFFLRDQPIRFQNPQYSIPTG